MCLYVLNLVDFDDYSSSPLLPSPSRSLSLPSPSPHSPLSYLLLSLSLSPSPFPSHFSPLDIPRVSPQWQPPEPLLCGYPWCGGSLPQCSTLRQALGTHQCCPYHQPRCEVCRASCVTAKLTGKRELLQDLQSTVHIVSS